MPEPDEQIDLTAETALTPDLPELPDPEDITDSDAGGPWFPAVVHRGNLEFITELAESLMSLAPAGGGAGVASDGRAKLAKVEARSLAFVLSLMPHGGYIHGPFGSLEWKEAPHSDTQGAVYGGARSVLFRWSRG